MGGRNNKTLSLDKIADSIAQLETSGGKNDKCKREGLGVNPYGYGQLTNRYMCFDNDKHVRKIVKAWFADKLTVMSLDEALCYYSSGKRTNKCDYAKKFKQLN